jgi:siroheme synthase
VIYMGLARLERIAAKLIENGAPPELPAAVISRGTTPEQRVTVAPLAHVASAAQSGGHESPALLIVGEVAALHATLAWFGGAAAAEVSESA